MKALKSAIKLIGLTGLANACGVSPQAVHKWRVNGIPAERVLRVERATGGRITRHQLRPDLYPKEEARIA